MPFSLPLEPSDDVNPLPGERSRHLRVCITRFSAPKLTAVLMAHGARQALPAIEPGPRRFRGAQIPEPSVLVSSLHSLGQGAAGLKQDRQTCTLFHLLQGPCMGVQVKISAGAVDQVAAHRDSHKGCTRSLTAFLSRSLRNPAMYCSSATATLIQSLFIAVCCIVCQLAMHAVQKGIWEGSKTP